MITRRQSVYLNLIIELNAEYPEMFRQFHRLDVDFFHCQLSHIPGFKRYCSDVI